VGKPEKQAIITACEAFIRDVLLPRFLPQIRPTQWNYVIDIHGAWAGRYVHAALPVGMDHNRGRSSTPLSRASTERPGSFRYLLDAAHGQMVAAPFG